MFNLFGNETHYPPANWRAPPTTRGTWDILSTCLITLGLCLWTVLHLNIPRHREHAWAQTLRKMAWLFVGLVAPEMIAYSAWYQRRAACKLDKAVKEKLNQPSTDNQAQGNGTSAASDGRNQDPMTENIELTDLESSTLATGTRRTWSKTHSFYAIMGGFVFDTTHAPAKFLPNDRERLTLTPRGLLYILENEPELLPDISTKYIRDKSKANGFAKTLVCLQALWFCIQCIVRLANGLGVSLLELNVFAHAICAVLLYWCWWDKPLDIEEPTILSGEKVWEMCALMCMRSIPSGSINKSYYPELPCGSRYGDNCEQNFAEVASWPAGYRYTAWVRFKCSIHRFLDTPRRFLECRVKWTLADSIEGSLPISEPSSQYVDLVYHSSGIGSTIHPGDFTTPPVSSPAVNAENSTSELQDRTLDLGIGPKPTVTKSFNGFKVMIKSRTHHRVDSDHRKTRQVEAPTFVRLSPTDIWRWRFCSRALQRYCPDLKQATGYQGFPAYQSVCERSPNWTFSDHLDFAEESGEHPGFAMWLGFSMAGLMYGGIHLLGWQVPFAATTEQWFWRCSGVVLASSGFVIALVVLIGKAADLALDWVSEQRFWKSLKKKLGSTIDILVDVFGLVTIMILSILFCAAGLVYIASRGYLVVASFIQLAHLPDSAYAVPTLSQYYPHIT